MTQERALRIAILLPDLSGGGAERLHVRLAHEWRRRGHLVEFLLMRRQGPLLELIDDIPVVDLGAARIRGVAGPLRRRLERTPPDHLLAAMWPLTSVAVGAWLAAGRPCSLFLGEHTQLSAASLVDGAAKRIALRASLFATHHLPTGVIAVSEGVKQDLCRLALLPQDRVQVIYNPAAIEAELAPRASGAGLWRTAAPVRILTVGGFRNEKDHPTLIRAFARVLASGDAELAIVGDGPLRPELEALIERLGLGARVQLPGYTQDPSEWYRSADLFVLSSRCEGFGNVIVEALSFGLPVVSTDCPSGPSEILEGGRYGRLAPIEDPAALARAIDLALAERPDREALRRRAQDFRVDEIADQYLRYFTTSTRRSAAR